MAFAFPVINQSIELQVLRVHHVKSTLVFVYVLCVVLIPLVCFPLSLSVLAMLCSLQQNPPLFTPRPKPNPTSRVPLHSIFKPFGCSHMLTFPGRSLIHMSWPSI